MKYTLDAGRLIVRDGIPLATVHGVGQYNPCAIDALAHFVVGCLNEVEALRAFKASVDEALNSGDGTYRP